MIVPAKVPVARGERELLACIAAGDRGALEELYLTYHRRLARFLARFAPRYESVEEIINDTFLAVWQGAGDFRNASKVSTWIMGIAYRTALKSRRSQRHHDTNLSLSEAPEPSVEPADETEVQDWLRQGVGQLSDEQRLTLELTYQLGHSLEEVSLITQAPIGTVKARLFHARVKLRQLLPELAGEPQTHRAGKTGKDETPHD